MFRIQQKLNLEKFDGFTRSKSLFRVIKSVKYLKKAVVKVYTRFRD